MKPKTKLEKEVVELSQKLPPLTDKHVEYAYSKLFDGLMYVSKKNKVCLECGANLVGVDTNQKTCICPSCGMKLKKAEYGRSRFDLRYTMCVVDRCEGYQVFRYLQVEKWYWLHGPSRKAYGEIVQNWVNDKGEIVALTVDKAGAFYNYRWVYGTFLQLRKLQKGASSDYRNLPGAHLTYPYMKLTPIAKRNGFKPVLGRFAEVLSLIITSSRYETLIKAKQYRLFSHFYRYDASDEYINKYWNSIKICMRNGYIVKQPDMWCDYIKLLSDLGKDTKNAKYVFPDNIKKAHDHYLKKKKELTRKMELQRLLSEIEEANKTYQEAKKPFLDLEFSKGSLKVEPLKSVLEFYNEGSELNHCVFENEYYNDDNSLILSAKVDGKRVETVEVLLNSLTINQSRGYDNKPTKYHKQIVSLVRQNLPKIAQVLTTTQ
jgi:predicted RNA-binding Zn-ribbon protein involved in translation (DUF1610 family)